MYPNYHEHQKVDREEDAIWANRVDVGGDDAVLPTVETAKHRVSYWDMEVSEVSR